MDRLIRSFYTCECPAPACSQFVYNYPIDKSLKKVYNKNVKKERGENKMVWRVKIGNCVGFFSGKDAQEARDQAREDPIMVVFGVKDNCKKTSRIIAKTLDFCKKSCYNMSVRKRG